MIDYYYKPVEKIIYDENRRVITCDYCHKIIYDSDDTNKYLEDLKEDPFKYINYFSISSVRDCKSEDTEEYTQDKEHYCSDDCLIRALLPKTENSLYHKATNPRWIITVESQSIRRFN